MYFKLPLKCVEKHEVLLVITALQYVFFFNEMMSRNVLKWVILCAENYIYVYVTAHVVAFANVSYKENNAINQWCCRSWVRGVFIVLILYILQLTVINDRK